MANGCLLVPYFCAALTSRRGRRTARLVLWGGEVRSARNGELAGQVMLDCAGGSVVVCRADGFYLGRPPPVLAIEDRLLGGRTYVVLPVDRLPQDGAAPLTAASLAALTYDRTGQRAGPAIAGGARSPFEYVKGDDGRTVIKVTPEFIVAAVTAKQAKDKAAGTAAEEACGGALCSTPELRKHYEQLVGAGRGRTWSPRLDTIKERKGRMMGLDQLALAVSPGRLSPVAVRLLGLDAAKGER